MVKCPKCGGYGKAVSTKNLENEVFRYHKCDECGYSFSSTQKANELSRLTPDNINKELMTDSFHFCIFPLMSAFSLDRLSFYDDTNNETRSLIGEYILHSIEFDDIKQNTKCIFEIRLKVHNDKAIGTIKLCDIENKKEIALVGFIYRDTDWRLELDIPTINKLL